jgi:hypothetical protein
MVVAAEVETTRAAPQPDLRYQDCSACSCTSHPQSPCISHHAIRHFLCKHSSRSAPLTRWISEHHATHQRCSAAVAATTPITVHAAISPAGRPLVYVLGVTSVVLGFAVTRGGLVIKESLRAKVCVGRLDILVHWWQGQQAEPAKRRIKRGMMSLLLGRWVEDALMCEETKVKAAIERVYVRWDHAGTRLHLR